MLKFPFTRGRQGDPHTPGHTNRHPGMSSFPPLQAGKKLDRHVEHVPFPGEEMAKLSYYVHWLLVGSSAEVLCTSTAPAGFPGTSFFYSALRELFIKMHMLWRSLARIRTCSKRPSRFCCTPRETEFVVADGRGQLDTTGAFLCYTHTREQTRGGGEPGDKSPLSANFR